MPKVNPLVLAVAISIILSASPTKASDTFQMLPDHGRMLIIVWDPLYNFDTLSAFVEWKQQKGIKTTVIKLSETYGYISGGLSSSMPETPRRQQLKTASGPQNPGRCCYGSLFFPSCGIMYAQECGDSNGTFVQVPAGWQCGDGPPYDCVPQTFGKGKSSEIKAYIDDFYAANPDLLWVLFIGGADQIATFDRSFLEVDINQTFIHSSDASYSLITGNGLRKYPDIVIGRFPVEDPDELATMVERIITYERDLPLPLEDQSWYNRTMAVARADDPVNNTGTSHVSHMRTIANTLSGAPLGMSVDSLYEINSSPPWNFTTINNFLNTGVSLWNYAGHGGLQGLGTASEGLFSTGDIQALTNSNRLPIIYFGSCNVGPIEISTGKSFAEEFVKAIDVNGAPIGAISVYASAPTQFFPPIDVAQKAYSQFLANGDNTTLGSLCYNSAGKMKNDKSNSQLADEMFLGWHVLGDPSLQVRTNSPKTMVVSSGVLNYDATNYVLTVTDMQTGGPVAGALCALYYQPVGTNFTSGTLYGSAFTDGVGAATIPISGILPVDQNVILTVTGFNRQTSTQGIHVAFNLVITTTPIGNTNITSLPYDITCEVYHTKSLKAGSPSLDYSNNGGVTWSSTVMTSSNGRTYTGQIPAQIAGTVVTYRISATDVNNLSFTTQEYSFTVYDYNVVLSNSINSLSAPDQIEVWYDVTLTNGGALDDSYNLSVANNAWPTTLWETNQITPLSNPVSVPVSNSTYSFKVRVSVSDPSVGATDVAQIIATSVGNVLVNSTLTLTTTSEGPTLSIPFGEQFLTTTFDATKWDFSLKNSIDGAGINEPSPSYSLRLSNSRSSEQMGQDTLTSRFMNLEGLSNVQLSYYYQRTGGGDSPEGGEDLIVEYLNDQNTWVEIARYLGSGADMTTYQQVLLDIPADGYHNRFKIRFSQISQTESGFPPKFFYDDWFVDDIAVAYVPPPVSCCDVPGDFNNDGAFNIADITAFIGWTFSGGSGPACCDEADANGDGSRNAADLTYMIASIFSGGPAPVCPAVPGDTTCSVP